MKADFTTQKTHLYIAPFYYIYLYILNITKVIRHLASILCLCVFWDRSSCNIQNSKALMKTQSPCSFVFICVVMNMGAA